MKKICFIEMEGILAPFLDYSPDKKRVLDFVNNLHEFCSKKKIELFLVSGFHDGIAHKKHLEHEFSKFFDHDHFLHVDDKYISSKQEDDKKLHLDKLKKDPLFNDSYFKQVAIQKILSEKKLEPKDALLFADDLWVDGYYTTRFSKIDFAIFEENVLDRGKKVPPLSGLAYFSLDPSSAINLIERFPQVSFVSLDKFVFEEMKRVLLDEKTLASSIRKGMANKKS